MTGLAAERRLRRIGSARGPVLIYLMFVIAAAVTGGLVALAARTQGIEHEGILGAIGVIAGGIQMLILIGWYLHHTREQPTVTTSPVDHPTE